MRKAFFAVPFFVGFSLWMNLMNGVAVGRFSEETEVSNRDYLAYRKQMLRHRLQRDVNADRIGKALTAELLPVRASESMAAAALKKSMADQISTVEAEMVDNGGANTARMDMAVNPLTGNLLVVWQDERNSFDAPDIYGQLFDVSMNRIGDNFIIPQQHDGIAQLGPAVAPCPDGGFMVVWEDYRSGKPAIYGRYVGSSGSLTAGEKAVSEEGSLFPDVACDTSGTVTVVWLSFSSDIYAIRGNRFHVSQDPLFPSMYIDDDLDGLIKGAPVVAAALNKNVIVAWEDQRSGDSDIWMQRIDAGGNRLYGNFKINEGGITTVQWHPSISASQFGFAVIWEDLEDSKGAIMLQRFDSSMLFQETNLRIDKADTVVKSLPNLFLSSDGATYIVWKQTFQEESTMMLTKLYPDNKIETPIPFNGPKAKSQPKVQLFGNHINLGWMETGNDFFDHVYIKQWATSVIPVELAEFYASIVGQGVKLHWRTASETNNLGFEIQRKRSGQEFRTIGFQPGNGTTCTETFYSFFDKDVLPGSYLYRLKQIDQDGACTYSNEISINIPEPSTVHLIANYPNPFNGETIIEFSLSEVETTHADIAVFDLHGRRIRTLLVGKINSGRYRLTWDGLTDQQLPATSGIYFIGITGNGNRLLTKVTLVR